MTTCTFTPITKVSVGGDLQCYLCTYAFTGNYASGGETISLGAGLALNSVKRVVGLYAEDADDLGAMGAVNPANGKLVMNLLTDSTAEAGTGGPATVPSNATCLVFGR